MKVIAVVLACLQFFSCASNGYYLNSDLSQPSEIYHLKAIGPDTEWRDGGLIAVSIDPELTMEVEYIETGATGLVFMLSLVNLSQSKIDVLTDDFICQQNNSASKELEFPILSEFEVLANYDKLINAFHDKEYGSDASVNVAEAVGLFVILWALFSIFLDDDSSKHHSQQAHDTHKSRKIHHSSRTRHSRSDSDHHISDLAELFFDSTSVSGDGASTNEISRLDRERESVQHYATLKQQQKEKLYKSKTVYPGERVSGQIFCPFKAVGDVGISISYKNALFEFERETTK